MKKTSELSPNSFPRQLILYGLSLAALLVTAGCGWLPESKATLAKRRVLEAVRTSMVPVRIYFKRDVPNEFDSDEEGASYQERFARQMVERKMSLDLGGLVLDDDGHILIADPEIEQRLIDRIEIVTADGTVRQGTLLTILKNMDAAILEISDAAGLVPVRFKSSKELDRLTSLARTGNAKIGSLPPLYLVSISRSGRDWYIVKGPVGESFLYNSQAPLPQYFLGTLSGDVSDQLSGSETTGSTPALITDGNGNFIGAVMRGIIDLDQENRIWRGEDILTAISADLNVDEFLRSQKSLEKQYARLYHRVKIYYRQPSEEDYAPTPKPERIEYGLALDSTHLLVPMDISRGEAKQIESIEVQLSDEDEAANQPVTAQTTGADNSKVCQAEFVGAYRDFAAFVVKIKDAHFDNWLDLDTRARITKVVPIRTIYARQRFGRKDLTLWYARCLREGKGYHDRVYLRPSTPVLAGSVLLDLDKRLAGFYLRERVPAEEQKMMEMRGSGYGYGYGGRSSGLGQTRIFPLSEIAAALRKPTDALDFNIQAMTKEQARRRMWLGVEYVPINQELAKRVNLEELTKDGTVGVRINSVYQGSPAEGIGIRPGDVLIRIKDLTRDYPTELRTSLVGAKQGRYSQWAGSSAGPAGAKVWKSRQNFLTEFLAAIGQEKNIELTFCSRPDQTGWKSFTKEVKVQLAPLDYDSAKRFRDRKIGLTVRDLTYEVRHALKMSDQEPGVVVSKIEEGTPAAVAKINEGELITRINSAEVVSVDDFKDKISAARQDQADSVKVEIVRLGKTRVADLSLSD